MKSIPNLSLAQLYPMNVGNLNINTCHDPDCGNYGVEADGDAPRFLGPNAQARAAKARSNSGSVGLGQYKLDGTAGAKYRRVSSAFEYQGNEHTWLDHNR